MPNNQQPTPGHMALLTNQMLVYKHRQVILRIVIPRQEALLKCQNSLRINLEIFSDLRITNPMFILRF